MKTIITFLLLAGMISAQAIHRLTPGTKGNKIILTIENSSNATDMTDIKTVVSKQLSSINFQLSEKEIEKIEKQSSKDVEFTFDVNRTVDINKTDTLKFLITTKVGSWTKEILIGYESPTEYKLEQNYPNPFNPETVIGYQLPVSSKVTLKIYDILGREVVTLVDERQEVGYYEKKFNAENLASGMYIYRLTAEKVNLVKKMMVPK
ncbi:T9SS type A sorting domain-containing protein [Melioribacteraceae bacterium 4301-Me]|uniref:T9SS type A sorting domain-containing protein n=1 Tax=Pyranulibacter aquaticus TaxID=3163344 RepID=UPI003594BD53